MFVAALPSFVTFFVAVWFVGLTRLPYVWFVRSLSGWFLLVYARSALYHHLTFDYFLWFILFYTSLFMGFRILQLSSTPLLIWFGSLVGSFFMSSSATFTVTHYLIDSPNVPFTGLFIPSSAFALPFVPASSSVPRSLPFTIRVAARLPHYTHYHFPVCIDSPPSPSALYSSPLGYYGWLR